MNGIISIRLLFILTKECALHILIRTQWRLIMKITFDTWNQNSSVDKATTSQDAPFVYKGQQASGAYALDISGTVMDNNAYGDHGRSVKDVMQSFDAQVDYDVQRDYMTVMSNILSTEDYNKMMKDGFDPSKIEPQQYVTILDHIKAKMAQSGQIIKGYNDDMDSQQLTEIVGDVGLASKITQALKNADLPVNEENVTAVKESLDKADSVSRFDDASKKYMVENHLEPTVENVYRASFSALGDGTKQSRGYYAQEMPGYFAKKADNIDWTAMHPQLEKAIDRMNLPERTREESLEQAKWLVEKGIPVTQETMNALAEVENLSIPLERDTVICAGVNALIKGKKASEGYLTEDTENIYEKAARYIEEANVVTEEAVKETVARGKEITLHNLYEAQLQIQAAKQEADGKSTVYAKGSMAVGSSVSIEVSFTQEKYITATRQLAEVQLRMTIDANIKLLKSDYSIDTAPLSELVDALKAQEQKLASQFFGDEDSESISAKADLFTQTKNVLSEIPFLPAAVVGRITYREAVSLTVVRAEGAALRAQYEAAGASYETLMTAPRADMGDSIKKAFRNVDDILQDMGLNLTEDNKKAVRILGYNNMEITQEAINDVKDTYIQVEGIIKSMTPQKTLSLIRDGVNPLTMDMNELETYLNQMDHTAEEEMTKYSRFLYELEKNGQVTDGEREAYIGVYRLFHQIEKSDGAAIGSLMAQGADLTLGNLLTAVRNRKAGKMDYSIDDSFGTLSETVKKGKSISGQIERGVKEARMARSIYRDLSVEGLQQMSINDQMTLEQLRDGLQMAGSEPGQDKLSEELTKDLLYEYRQNQNMAADVEDMVLDIMKQQNIPFTMENLLAVNAVLTGKGQLARSAKDIAKKIDMQGPKSSMESSLAEAEKEIVDQFTDYDSAQNAMEKWEDRVRETMEEAVSEISYTSNEIKDMYMNSKQLSVMNSMRKAESYEVPMEINGEMTSVNLTLVHDTENKGTVSITMNTNSFGKAGVRFKVSENCIESYFVADSEMGKERLQKAGEKILKTLHERGMKIGDTHYVNAHAQGRKDWNLLTFSKHNADKSNETVATKQLYQIARTFLIEMREFT